MAKKRVPQKRTTPTTGDRLYGPSPAPSPSPEDFQSAAAIVSWEQEQRAAAQDRLLDVLNVGFSAGRMEVLAQHLREAADVVEKAAEALRIVRTSMTKERP